MARAITSPFNKSVYERNARIYRLLANPIRLEILNIIKNKDVTVDELSAAIGIRKSNTSQHLSVLKNLKVVTYRRNGKNTFYSIADPKIIEPCRILNDLWGNAAN